MIEIVVFLLCTGDDNLPILIVLTLTPLSVLTSGPGCIGLSNELSWVDTISHSPLLQKVCPVHTHLVIPVDIGIGHAEAAEVARMLIQRIRHGNLLLVNSEQIRIIATDMVVRI